MPINELLTTYTATLLLQSRPNSNSVCPYASEQTNPTTKYLNISRQYYTLFMLFVACYLSGNQISK